MSSPLTVRDTRGRVLFHMEADDAELRDDSGKRVAVRAGKDEELHDLSLFAARRMDGALTLDLAPGDVVSGLAMRADFGIPGGWAEFIADEVSPVTYIAHDRGSFFCENVADGIQIVQAQANLVSAPTEVNPGFAATQFVAQGYALAARVPMPVWTNADFDMRKRTTRFLVDALRRGREARVAKQLTTAATFLAANQIAVTSGKWDGAASGAPVTDLFAALHASYLPADTLIMPEIAAPYFAYSGTGGVGGSGPQVRDFVQGGGQLPRILYAKAKQFSGGGPAYVWMPTGVGNIPLVRTTVHERYPLPTPRSGRKPPAKDWALDGRDFEPNDSITDIGTSHTLRWLGDSAKDGARVGGVLVREFEEPGLRGGGRVRWIVVAMNDIEITPSNTSGAGATVGAIITGAIA
jgi:hypothetical protein